MFLNIQYSISIARRYSLPDAIPYVIGNDNTTGYRIDDSASPGIREGRRLKIMKQRRPAHSWRAFSIQQIEEGAYPRPVRPREQPFAGG
jgi:hypothetical protein